MRTYGSQGLHYNDAKNVVDKYVEDSIVKAKKAEAEAKAKAEAEQKEDASYKNCTTIAACDSYLKAYPEGRYVSEVKAKKAELEQKEAEKAKAEAEKAKKEAEKAKKEAEQAAAKKKTEQKTNNQNANVKTGKEHKTDSKKTGFKPKRHN